MIRRSIICYLLLVSALAVADDQTETYRLLKSWGLQFDVNGRLNVLPREDDETEEYQPWRPDLSELTSAKPQIDRSDALQPVVISSRQKKEK